MRTELNITILYVEDNKLLRDEIEKFLNRFAKKLYIAKDGKEGLETFIKYQPDIIISDIKMPNMNGLEMVQAIKAINQEQHIIYTTAHSESSYFLDAINMQVSGFILKPIDYNQLRDKIIEIAKNINMENNCYLNN